MPELAFVRQYARQSWCARICDWFVLTSNRKPKTLALIRKRVVLGEKLEPKKLLAQHQNSRFGLVLLLPYLTLFGQLHSQVNSSDQARSVRNSLPGDIKRCPVINAGTDHR